MADRNRKPLDLEPLDEETFWDEDDDLDWEDTTSESLDEHYGVRGLWSRYGGASPDQANRIIEAQRMVQGFVDTFTPAGEHYTVTFDEDIQTAGTDFTSKQVKINHRPLFDPSLREEDAGRVMIAMAAHEASHARYGFGTYKAVKRAFAAEYGSTYFNALRLSNLLDDVRIERRFAGDYPGYEDIFHPALAYVAQNALYAEGVESFKPSLTDQFQLAVAAVRYPEWSDWSNPKVAAERDWWQDWASRSSRTDRTKDYLAAIDEALAHIAATEPEPEPPVTDGGTGGGGPTGGNQPDGGSTGQPPEGADEPVRVPGGCLGDALAEATDHVDTISSGEAQEIVSTAQNLAEYEDERRGTSKSYGEVYWGWRGIASNRARLDPEVGNAAGSVIRAAFARSRSGHGAVDHHLKTGTLDDRNLYRLAQQDTNLCRRRRAPSPGNYLVWLMVDCSGSMQGLPIRDATNVAVALARACRYLPNVELNVWGWTNQFHRAHVTKALNVTFGAVRVYHPNAPVEDIGALLGVPMGGTPDGDVILWASKEMAARCRRDQQPILIMASDGMGNASSEIIEKARKRGVRVISVAIGSLDEDHQRSLYGDGNYSVWQGSVVAAARPLGKMIGRIAADKSVR